MDFLLQVTAFVALIVFDFLRAEDKRVDCFPCIKVSSSYADSDKGNVCSIIILIGYLGAKINCTYDFLLTFVSTSYVFLCFFSSEILV